MIGLVSMGEKLKVTDRISFDYNKIGTVVRIERQQVTLEMEDGRRIVRALDLERVPA